MPTYRLDIEYEGTRYRGWQQQQNARSVAGELRRAIETAGASFMELGGSGRTDAGVHALAQTAHLRLRGPIQPESFRAQVNAGLPPDIHLLSVREAAPRFHARHNAIARSYLYQIARRRSGLAKPFVWWIKRPIDVDALARAAALLPGMHDFVQFCERPAEQTSTLVLLEQAEIACVGGLVLVRLVASHYLWKMVRRVVGSLVRVAGGELSHGDMLRLINGESLGPDRSGPAQWTAPPSGLFLERVLYPGEPGLGPLAPAVPVPDPPPDLRRRLYLGPSGPATPGRAERGHVGR